MTLCRRAALAIAAFLAALVAAVAEDAGPPVFQAEPEFWVFVNKTGGASETPT